MLNGEQQRKLGGEVATLLDRYGLEGPNRIWVLLHAAWGEAQRLGVSPVTMATNAMQIWRGPPNG